MRFVGVLASVTLAAVLRACMGLLFAFSGGVARYLARFFFAVSVAVINDDIMHPVILPLGCSRGFRLFSFSPSV